MQNVKIKFAYKQGFRRLWLVLSVIWLLIVYVIGIQGRNDIDYQLTASYGLIPPLALYCLGAAFVWIVEGFAKADR
ncbi:MULTISPECIES: hypothetical protein [unclassified Pseudomonas]|uniref:hypothetical protein n=1 Tax=unclassified Pseudomonas TaxID=196821 RepID=UPI002B2388D9|nr:MULTISPECIES: hypothetical protein [unclassified Pseudomonas]MEA9979449.1 hypothetical protein [Pseudomonas sp. RTS4]MEB0197914.1 hypothetical protein [Pseudomonas sp. 5S4]MEB0246400.1 hypothetical protein [Pseudomonas sp. 10S5]